MSISRETIKLLIELCFLNLQMRNIGLYYQLSSKRGLTKLSVVFVKLKEIPCEFLEDILVHK